MTNMDTTDRLGAITATMHEHGADAALSSLQWTVAAAIAMELTDEQRVTAAANLRRLAEVQAHPLKESFFDAAAEMVEGHEWRR